MDTTVYLYPMEKSRARYIRTLIPYKYVFQIDLRIEIWKTKRRAETEEREENGEVSQDPRRCGQQLHQMIAKREKEREKHI